MFTHTKLLKQGKKKKKKNLTEQMLFPRHFLSRRLNYHQHKYTFLHSLNKNSNLFALVMWYETLTCSLIMKLSVHIIPSVLFRVSKLEEKDFLRFHVLL